MRKTSVATVPSGLRPRSAGRTTVRRRAGGESGQALVELALVLPVMILIAMGIVDFGRVFYTYEALVNAAREGARYCALYPRNYATAVAAGTTPPSNDPATRITGELAGTVTLASASPIIVNTSSTTCPASGTDGQPVSVTLAAAFSPITPGLASIFGSPVGNTITMHAQATMMTMKAS